TAGQQVNIDARWVNGNSPYQTWVLLAPNGQTVASGSTYYTYDNSRKATLPADGTYVLYLVGDSRDKGSDDSTVTISPVTNSTTAIHLGDQVSATLAGPGDTNQYPFTLTQATTVLVRAQGGNANVSLTGPDGATVYATGGSAVNFNSGTIGEYYVLRLDAGTYSFNVSGSGASTPSYAFSVSDMLANVIDDRNTGTVTGTAPAQGGVGVYQLEATPGTSYNLVFKTPAPTDYGNAVSYSLVDAAGRALAPTQYYWSNGQSVAYS